MLIEPEVLKYNDSPTAARKRTLILETSFQLFLEKSIDDCSMVDIGEKAGISRRSLYNYYQTKEAIAEDLQMICLETMNWYGNMLAFVIDPSPESLYEGGKLLLREFLPQLQYISHFDFYFPENYLSESYLAYIKKQQNLLVKEILKSLKIQAVALLSTRKKEMTLLQVFSGYLQRLSLRIRLGENCPPEYLDELKLFLDSML